MLVPAAGWAAGCAGGGSHERTRLILVPCPGVSKPDGREQIQWRQLGSTIRDGDTNQDILHISLRILDKDVKVAILVKDSGTQQLEFGILASASAVLFDQSCVGILLLRILVEILHVRVCRRAVEIKIVLFDVLAVVAFASSETKQPFLEYGVPSVPQCKRKADQLMTVGDSGDAVFIPTVCLRTRVIVRQVVPCRAVRAVVFADGSPCPFTQIRSPAFPVRRATARFS